MSLSSSTRENSATPLTQAENPGSGVSCLKIAIVHPTSWPYVRRGTERFMNELALYLSRRGHQVKIICSKPGRREIVRERGYVTDYHRSFWHPSLARLGVLEFHVFPLTTLASLLREQFDLVHCFNFTDALVAAWVRQITRAHVVLHLTNIPPTVKYRRSLSTGGAVLRRAIHAADEIITIVISQQQYFEKRFGRRGVTIPVPVDTEAFPLSLSRNHAQPTILCASALEDRRKGGRLLMRAFNRVKQVRPEVRMEISSNVSDELRTTLLELVAPQWRSDVRFLGAGNLTDLPRLYGGAALVVAPSLWEAFGMVLLESLATGTPVVATKASGFHEAIHPLVGRAFEPGPPDQAEPSNLEGLVQALLETLELSRRPETPRHCRAVAERFSWQILGPRFEEVYQRVLGRTAHTMYPEEL